MAAATRKRDSKHAHRETFDIIKTKTKEIIQSRKNGNLIIDILSYLEVIQHYIHPSTCFQKYITFL